MVQHPGCEPRVHPTSGVCPENTSGHHKRKFMQASGDYVDSATLSLQRNKQFRFWGEYEMESMYMCNTKPPFYGHCNPFAVHMPIYPRTKAKYINTDPLVFGERFYYSCCHFPKNTLTKGDVVLFGTYFGANYNEFHLDTFFIVKDTILISTLRKVNKLFDMCTPLKYKTPQKFAYEAIMYTDGLDYFSFVPCKPKPYFFGRPVIKDWKDLRTLSSTHDVFNEVVNQIKGQQFDLGVRLDVPPTSVSIPFPLIP